MEENKQEPRKIKILAHCDSPSTATGFGKVSYGIFKKLAETGRYDITIFGVNDRGGWKDPKEHPYKIYMTMPPGEYDVYGRVRFLNVVRGADQEVRPYWDIIFTLNDPFVYEEPVAFNKGFSEILKNELQRQYIDKVSSEKWFKIVSYWPVDSAVKPNWVENAIGLANYSVAYTNYGKKEIEKATRKVGKEMKYNLSTIYHGVDTENFYPLSQEDKDAFRQKFFKTMIRPGTFVVGVVARNQMRKDIPRSMKIFREFQKRRPNSFLYIHAKDHDVWGSLHEYAKVFGLEHGRDWTFPGNFNENVGYPVSGLNKIYNVLDVLISTSLGEGWGLPLTEAMATKTLTMAPNITSIPEIYNSEGLDIDDPKQIETNDQLRGIPLKSGSTSSEWVTHGPTDYERVRPLTNVDDALKKLLWVYDNPEKTQVIKDRAYDWVQTISWNNIADQWDKFFQVVMQDLDKDRQEGLIKIKEAKENPKSIVDSSESKK